MVLNFVRLVELERTLQSKISHTSETRQFQIKNQNFILSVRAGGRAPFLEITLTRDAISGVIYQLDHLSMSNQSNWEARADFNGINRHQEVVPYH